MRKNIRENKLNLLLSMISAIMCLYCFYPFIRYCFPFNGTLFISLIVILFACTIIISWLVITKLRKKWIGGGTCEGNITERRTSLDLIRTIACILVITVHYVNRTSYYSSPAQGTAYFAVSVIRWIAQCCCPLFMILSGYFLCNRSLDKKFGHGLWHFLRNYFVICLFYLLYTAPMAATAEKIKGLCNLSYMWYINMYFGLFLLTPFLNIMWKALNEHYKICLLIVLLLLGSFSSVTDFWWTNYWNGLYPILYYFLGVWFREREFTMKKFPGIVLFMAMILMEALYTYYVDPGQVFDWLTNFGGYSSAYNAMPTVIASCIIFILCKDIKLEAKYVKPALRKISENSLEIYLALCMFLDGMIFPYIWAIFAPKAGIVGVYFILVPIELFAAVLFGIALNKILDKLQKLFLSIFHRCNIG